MKSDLKEILERVESDGNYIISSIANVNGKWEMEVIPAVQNDLTLYELCEKLNGRNKNDYFSIITAENKGAKIFIQTERKYA